MNSLLCLLTHCQSLPNFCHNQIMVSVTICFPERSDIKYTWIPSPVYQNMVNLVVRLSVRRCTSEFIDVTMREYRTFDNKIFGCGKVYYSNSILITNFVQTLIFNCWFENVFPTDFVVEISQQNFRMVFREFIEYTFWLFIEPALYIITFILCWSIIIQNNHITQATF
jgi:hypothetical protein